MNSNRNTEDGSGEGTRRGRKPKYSPALRDALADLIGKGLPVREACASVDISPATYYAWQNDEKLDFLQHLTRAKARWLEKALAQIEAAGQQDWRATAWLVEKRFHSDFGKRESVRVEAVPADVSTSEDLSKAMEILKLI